MTSDSQRCCLLFSIGLMTIVSSVAIADEISEIINKGNQSAPAEAWEDDPRLAYYGSENPWDERFFVHHSVQGYGRFGERQLIDIVRGKPKEAIQYCEELLKDDPNDQESLFNMAVAYAHLKDEQSAIASVHRALDAGLPFARFLAGPRGVLKPLISMNSFANIVAQHPTSLLHGPMLGCVTDHSASFWVRTADEKQVEVVLSTNLNLVGDMLSKTGETSAKHDYTAIITIENLAPDTVYFCNVRIAGQPVMKSEFPSFRTYPTAESHGHFSVAFGGGAGYNPPRERMWDTIRSRHPAAFLTLGDNVYIDAPTMPEVQRYCYYARQSRPEFRKLVASTPIYAIWDDHDAAIDDVWLGPFRDRPDWKLQCWQVFCQNWNNPGYGGGESVPGCWFRFSIADVDFFLLDGRFYRTNPYAREIAGTEPSMLGPDQKAWLLNGLKKSNATFKVIASPVPWDFNTKAEARDTWNGFQAERNEIFSCLGENHIDGVILVSADRHRSDAIRIDRKNAYPLYEFESSWLTNSMQMKHPKLETAMFSYNDRPSFGLLTFDTRAADPTVTFNIVNIDNSQVYAIELKKSVLSHAK